MEPLLIQFIKLSWVVNVFETKTCRLLLHVFDSMAKNENDSDFLNQDFLELLVI